MAATLLGSFFRLQPSSGLVARSLMLSLPRLYPPLSKFFVKSTIFNGCAPYGGCSAVTENRKNMGGSRGYNYIRVRVPEPLPPPPIMKKAVSSEKYSGLKYFLCFTLQNNPPLYLDTGTQLLKYGPIISKGPEQNQATVFHLKRLEGTGEDVNTPIMDTHLQIGSEETLTITKKLETEMEQISETDRCGVLGPREFRCHMIPIVTPDVPAKLNPVTETAYTIEFKPGGTPQVFTVKVKAGKCLSFSADLGNNKTAYMQIPNTLSSMSDNMVQMNTEVEEKDSFVVLPKIFIGPLIPESVTGGGDSVGEKEAKLGAGLCMEENRAVVADEK